MEQIYARTVALKVNMVIQLAIDVNYVMEIVKHVKILLRHVLLVV